MEEIKTIAELVSSVGFPIVCAGVMFYQNSRFSDTVTTLTNTLGIMNERIGRIENKLEMKKKED